MNEDYLTYLEKKFSNHYGITDQEVSDEYYSTAENLAVWSMMGLFGAVLAIAIAGMWGLL